LLDLGGYAAEVDRLQGGVTFYQIQLAGGTTALRPVGSATAGVCGRAVVRPQGRLVLAYNRQTLSKGETERALSNAGLHLQFCDLDLSHRITRRIRRDVVVAAK